MKRAIALAIVIVFGAVLVGGIVAAWIAWAIKGIDFGQRDIPFWPGGIACGSLVIPIIGAIYGLIWAAFEVFDA